MNPTRNQFKITVLVLLGVVVALVALAAAVIRAGVYNVGADDPHYPVTYAVLEQLRDASIETRARQLEIPADLMSENRVTQGAGNYDAMCTQCHLMPGMESTELSRGLYPSPPNLTKSRVDAAEAFWVIKHGIKASGMPAWGESMADEYVWNMAAFLQRLPDLDETSYREIVAKSGGHSHGGGESEPAGTEHAHDEAAAAPSDAGHPHPPGTPAHEDPPVAAPHHHEPGTPAHDDGPKTKAKDSHPHAPGAAPHKH